MKENETEYLNKLFDATAEATEGAVPLLEVPEHLSSKLYQIAEPAEVGASFVKPSLWAKWPKVASVAAALVVAVMGLQFYQQQQTLKQLAQAQADLATALHYLGEANRIARAQVRSSLNDNIKAGVEPAVQIGREALLPNLPELKATEPETKTPTRTL